MQLLLFLLLLLLLLLLMCVLTFGWFPAIRYFVWIFSVVVSSFRTTYKIIRGRELSLWSLHQFGIFFQLSIFL